MFAFVLVTPDRVIAARDPLGIKPLYKANLGGGVVFASELKAFDDVDVADVEEIAPGVLYDSVDGCREWHRMPHGAAESLPDEDPEPMWRELRIVLETAVRKWMVADVEVGCFLSGGLDSSIIAALAAGCEQPSSQDLCGRHRGQPGSGGGAVCGRLHRLRPP